MATKPKTYPVEFTRSELIHLRDLFNVLLPSEEKRQTVSQALAEMEDRSEVEALLWENLAAVCKTARVPVDTGAPDFVCTVSAAPPVDVFRLEAEPSE